MANEVVAAPQERRPFFHFWFPRLVVGVAALALVLLWGWPSGLERLGRVLGTWLVCQLAVLCLLVWLLVFSGQRWAVRLGAVLMLAVLLATVRNVRFDGDMAPTVEWRGSRTADDILEAHRHAQTQAATRSPEQVAPAPEAFPQYRGPQRDGSVRGPVLARDWQAQPPRLLWRQPVGGGYSGLAVAGPHAVTLEQRRDQEVIVCYDAASGREQWVHAYPAHFSEILGGDGPRATPTLDGNEVFSLGATGQLACLELNSGTVRWTVNILDGNDNVSWGMSGSPLLADGLVIVNPGVQRASAPGGSLAAYDRHTGQRVWSSGTRRAGYSSPMLATLAGCRQVILFDGEGVGGYQMADGVNLWWFPWETQQGINVVQPLVLSGDRVFISSAYGVGCALLQIAEVGGKWSAAPVWKNRLMRCKFSSPVAYQGHIYGLDEGILACLDEKTGQRLWRDGRYGHGQLLLAGDLLVILGEAGQLALVEATPRAYRELGRLSALEGKTWNPPALAGGRAFLRNHREMACFDLRAGVSQP